MKECGCECVSASVVNECSCARMTVRVRVYEALCVCVNEALCVCVNERVRVCE